MAWLTLLANLPEAHWPEATRRLLAVPALRAVVGAPALAPALAAHLTDLAQFTPAGLTLAAHRLSAPDFDPANPPPEALAQAFARLTAPELARSTALLTAPATPWHPVTDTLLAALAVHRRWQAGADSPAHLAEALTPNNSSRWQMVFQVLWAWLTAAERMAWLAVMLPAHPALAVAALAAHPADQAAEWLISAAQYLTPGVWPAVSAALTHAGLADCLTPLTHHLTTSPARADMLPASVWVAGWWAHSGNRSQAQPALVRAWHDLRLAQADMSAHLGWLALQANDPATALGAFQEALAVNPKHAPAQRGAARALLALHQPEPAIQWLNQIQPATPETAVWLAWADHQRGHTASAQARLNALTPASLTESPAVRQAALLFEEWGDQEAALRWWQRACALHPTDSTGWEHLAALHRQAEDWEAARACLHVLVGLQPHNPAYRRLAGQTARQGAHWQEASQHYRALTAVAEPEPAEVWALAECAFHQQDFEAALSAAQQAAPALPTPADQAQAYALAAQAATALHQPEEAMRLWRQAVDLNPRAGPAWLALADLYAAQGDSAALLATLEAAHHALSQHETAPELPQLRARLGQMYAEAHRLDEAQAVLQLAAPTPATLALLGHILHRQGYLEAAARTLRQAVNAHPQPEPLWHELGRVLEAQGQLAEAIHALHNATRQQPVSPAHLDLGRLLLAEHARSANPATLTQAVHALRHAVTAQPENAAAHALLAQALHLAGDTQAALIHYQNAVRLDPASPDWPLALGQVWLSAGQPDQAIACLLEAVRQHPTHVAAHVWLGQAFAVRRLWHKAARMAAEALALDAHHVEAHVLAATAAVHTGQPARAAEHWQTALQLRPRDPDLLTRYARAMLTSQPAAARAALTQALAVSPGTPALHQHIAALLRALGDHAAAYTVLSQASQNAARDPALWTALAECAAHLERHAEAHTAWLRVAELQPADPEPLNQAAHALWRAGRAEAALALWERARQRSADHAPTLLQLGLALNQLERYSQALPVFQHAIAAHPQAPDLLTAGARAALHAGEWPLAQTWLEQARALAPDDPETALLLSESARHRQDGEAALTYAQQAAALRPADPRALTAQAVALAELNRTAEAQAVLRHALAELTDSVPAATSALVLRSAHALLIQWCDWPAAVQAAQQWCARAPHSAAALMALASAHIIPAEWASHAATAHALADLPAADLSALQDMLNQALALGADSQLAQAWLGRAQAAHSLWAEACATLEPLAANAEPAARLALARALNQHGQPLNARAALLTVTDAPAPAWVRTAALLELTRVQLALDDARGAVVTARRAVAGAPDIPLWQALSHYHLSLALETLGDAADSQHALLTALQRLPTPAWHARYAERAPDPATALAHWQQAYTRQPNQPAWAWAYARALAADGDWPQAVAQYRRLTTLCPDEAPAWAERGQAHLQVGDAVAAQTCFAQALRLHPEHVPAWVGRARAHLLARQPAEALESAQQATRLDPEHAEARLALAEAYAAQEQWAEARAHYLQATATADNPAPAWLGVGEAWLAERQWREAAHAFAQAVTADPQSALAFARLGEARLAERAYPHALAAFTEAARLEPRQPAHWQNLARTCQRLGQLDQALAHLNHALTLAPQDDALWHDLGLVFEQRKQFDRALEAYQQAIRLAPRQAQHYLRAGLAHKHLKDYAQAVAALERATALEPKNVDAARHLAAVSALHLIHA